MQVFISHSSVDKPFVRRLNTELKERNLNVWLDETDIRVGQSITKEISLALLSADVFCYVISEASIKSNWVDREYSSIMSLIISGKAILIPCRIDKAKIPTLINDIKYADFRESFEIGLKQLLEAIVLKEEIEFQQKIESTINKISIELNFDEVAFFYYHFSTHRIYMISSNRQIAPRELLNYLYEEELLELHQDRQEFCYSISGYGKEVLNRLLKNIDTSLFNKFPLKGTIYDTK